MYPSFHDGQYMSRSNSLQVECQAPVRFELQSDKAEIPEKMGIFIDNLYVLILKLFNL